MREIKFRYWDTFDYEHKMIYFDLGMVSGGKVYPNMKTTMQYIGLKDKNGKEIYEGDILKYTFGGVTKVNVIEFSPPIFTYRDSMRWSLNEDEVIGNIYENPDLLK